MKYMVEVLDILQKAVQEIQENLEILHLWTQAV